MTKAPILRPPQKPASIVTYDWLVRLPPKPQPQQPKGGANAQQ